MAKGIADKIYEVLGDNPIILISLLAVVKVISSKISSEEFPVIGITLYFQV